jgi:hypothetical protein
MADKREPKVVWTSTPGLNDSLIEKLMRDGREETWRREFMNSFEQPVGMFADFGGATASSVSAMRNLGDAMKMPRAAYTSAAEPTEPAKTIRAQDLKDLAKRLESDWPTSTRRSVGRLDLDYLSPHPGAQEKTFKIDMDGITGPGFKLGALDGTATFAKPAEPELRGHRRIAEALRRGKQEEALLRAAQEATAKPEPVIDRGSEWGSW